MNKKKIYFFIFAGITILGAGWWYFYLTSVAAPQTTLTEIAAREIAERTCIKGGETIGPGSYNTNSKTWWFDANLNAAKDGCHPACVVSLDTKIAVINWRCTGLANPISTFEECQAMGNPVMESYPRRCAVNGKTFTEIIPVPPQVVGGDSDEHGCKASAGYSWCAAKQKCLRMWEEPCPAQETACTAESQKGDVCPTLYAPVCATVQIQCIKAPCYPILQTFSNGCIACHNSLVSSYSEGACANEGDQVCPQECPTYSPPAPNWCKDGTIIPPAKDKCGCLGHPVCQTK